MFEAQYERIKLLGEGSFGSAYLVRDRHDADSVQVAKEIRLAHLSEQQRQSAFAEAEVLRMMSHSNIVAYVATFLEGPTLHILMEYADGGDLSAKIRQRREAEQSFREREVMFIFVQLSLALAHVHAKNILHRDLKPLNVFLTSQGVVKLGDFGIARVIESATAGAQTVIGTPHYLSPEICNNQPYGVKSDLWSLGVVLYEIAALQVPFAATSLPAVVMKICNVTPHSLPDSFSQELVDIVFNLLDKKPSKRACLNTLLRSNFVQRHVQELLSHSLHSDSGGCEDLVSGGPIASSTTADAIKTDKRGVVCPTQLPRRSEKPGIEDSTQLPTLMDHHEDPARAEFFRNRAAALQAKQRAESGGSCITGMPRERPAAGLQTNWRSEFGGSCANGAVQETPAVVPDMSDKNGSAVEVRQRAREEREQRDASRKRELENAMREARQNRKAVQDLRLARESNPLTGGNLPQPAAENPTPLISGNPTLDVREQTENVSQRMLQASEDEQSEPSDFRQELYVKTESRPGLGEKNGEACYSPPLRSPHTQHMAQAAKEDQSWAIQIPFHDKPSPHPQLAPGEHIALEITIKSETASRPHVKILQQPDLRPEATTDNRPLDAAADVHNSLGGTLSGTSRFLPIASRTGTLSQLSRSDVSNLQAVLSSALSNASGLDASRCLSMESGTPGGDLCKLEESHESLEYTATCTEMSGTLLSVQEAPVAAPPEAPNAAAEFVRKLVCNGKLVSHPAASSSSTAEDLSPEMRTDSEWLPYSSSTASSQEAEPEPLPPGLDASSRPLSPVSPAPIPPSTSAEFLRSPNNAAPSALLPSPFSPKRISPASLVVEQPAIIGFADAPKILGRPEEPYGSHSGAAANCTGSGQLLVALGPSTAAPLAEGPGLAEPKKKSVCANRAVHKCESAACAAASTLARHAGMLW